MRLVDLCLGQHQQQDLVVIESLRRLEVQDRTLRAALLVLASRGADGVAYLQTSGTSTSGCESMRDQLQARDEWSALAETDLNVVDVKVEGDSEIVGLVLGGLAHEMRMEAGRYRIVDATKLVLS